LRYDVPLFVRRHHDGRFTLAVVDRVAPLLVAHDETREAAEEALRAALVSRIEDAADPLGPRLRADAARELRRSRIGVRVRRRSGRRAEVVVPVTWILVRPVKGTPEAFVPRLGLWLDLPPGEDPESEVVEVVRGQLAGGPDEGPLDLALDADETLAALEVDAKPRERLGPGGRRDGQGPGALEEVGLDLTADLARERTPVAHGRDGEVASLLASLAAAPPASVLLVGPAGVGKTAVVREAARRIAAREAPAALARARIFHLTGSRVIAGMRYLGDWEERCRRLVDDARERHAVLFVDDLCELCEAGRFDERDAGVARFLAPHVARGEIALVAESTPERLRRVERIDASILPLFRRLLVNEHNRAQTLDVLRRAAVPLGRRHGVRFRADALEATVDLTGRFMPGRKNPGKAAELLGRVGEAVGRERGTGGGAGTGTGAGGGAGQGAGAGAGTAPREVDPAEVAKVFARETGIPEDVLREDRPLDRKALVAGLEARVVEQGAAAGALADAVLLLKAGLASPSKPVAVYLFVGPTGVGKTESARALAERLFGDGKRLIRFDMSEYQDPAGYLRLAGGEGLGEGELAKRIRAQPFSVVLLDEIEKAHEATFDLLLSVLGEGRLVDHGGRVADFRSAIVILTSNLGATEAEPIGFAGEAAGEAAARYRRAAEAFFRPELLDRIDRIVPFAPLSPAGIERIAARELDAVVAREGLARRRVAVRFDPALVAFLARKGFHPRFGARPLKREVERRVLAPLARHLARRGGRGAAELELYRDGEDVRIAARDVGPRLTFAREFFDADEGAAPERARLLDGVSAVRVRVQDLVESFVFRTDVGRGPAGRALDARAAAALAAVLALAARVEALPPDAPPAGRADLAADLRALDVAATDLETELLLAWSAPPPLPALSIVERAAGPGGTPGAARELLVSRYLAWARAKGIGATATPAGVRFDDPSRAAPLDVECGVHELGLDASPREARGARVSVSREGDAGPSPTEVVRRHAAAGADDPRTGLFQNVGAAGGAVALDRFVLARLRRRAAGDAPG